MSDFNKLLQKEPDFLPYADWEKDNNSGDALKNRKNYSDYVRGQYADAGNYGDEIENEIRQATVEGAIVDGIIPKEDKDSIDYLITPDKLGLDPQLEMIQNNLDSQDPAWQAATSYLTFKKLNPEGPNVPEDIRLKGEQYLADVQSTIDSGYQRAATAAVRSNELPLAKIINEKGEQEIIASANLGNMSLSEAIRNSKKGGITFADTASVKSLMSVPLGYTEPLYKIKRYDQAAAAIQEFAKKNDRVATVIEEYSDELAESDKEGRSVKSFDQATNIRDELNSSGLLPENEYFSDEEIQKAVTQLAYLTANSDNKFKLYDDVSNPTEMAKNVRNVGYRTPFVHPAAMVNDELFKKSVLENNSLTESQKNTLSGTRETYLQAHFDEYNKKLSESSVSDDWLNTLQSNRANGKKDTDTLKEFIADKDNFSEFKDRLSGVGKSIVDGVGELVAAVPMMMGAEWARDYMVGNLKERSNRREVARLFGVEYGIGQELAETIAPMLVDVSATALLSLATAPAAGSGGAALFSAKQGARLTAKGLLKSMTSNALRQLPTETLEEAGERILAQGLIKSSTADAGRSGAMAAIKGYNSTLAKTIGIQTAVALPAFNRSAGATYASVYSTLEGNKELTPEQRHDRALGAGLAAGTITAAITTAFGAIGRGGLDDALLSGASYKQLKQIVERMGNVGDIGKPKFNALVASQVSETLAKYGTLQFGKQVGKSVIDEGAEEGLDEFINGFVTDAATDEDTPFLERLEQSARAALIGGVIGGAAPVITSVKEKVQTRGNEEIRTGIEVEFARGVSAKLAESGSPVTAQTVYSILTAPKATRAAFAAKALPAEEVVAPVTQDESQEGTTIKEEAGAEETESAPSVLTPKSLVAAGKPAPATTEAGTTTPTEAPPNQQATPVALNLQEEIDSALSNPVSLNGNNVEFVEIPYSQKWSDTPDGPVTEQSGQLRAISIAGRPVVVASINGVRVPFYQSTGKGGKKEVATNKWYPIFGIKDGWFNKGSVKLIQNYYGSQELRDVAQYLDSNIGNIIGSNIKAVSFSEETSPQIMSINEGLNPSENKLPDTVDRVQQNIDDIITRLEASRPVVEQGTAAPSGEQAPAITPLETAAPIEDTRQTQIKNLAKDIREKLKNTSVEDTKKAVSAVIVNQKQKASTPVASAIPSPVQDNKDKVDPDGVETAVPTAAAPKEVAPKKAKKPVVAAPTAAPKEVAPTAAAPKEVAPTAAAPKEVAPTAAAPKEANKPAAAAPTVITTKEEQKPSDALAFTKKDEQTIRKNAAVQGLDGDEAVSQVRKTMNKMGLIAPNPEEEEAEAPKTEGGEQKTIAKEKKEKKPKVEKPPTLMGEILNEEVDKVVNKLAEAGAVIRFKKSTRYGLPVGFDQVSQESDLSNEVAKRVFNTYKPLTLEEVSELYQVPMALMSTSNTPPTSWWNPFTGEFKTNDKIKYRTIIDGGKKFGLFDNNPLTIASMLRKNLPVYIPSTFTGQVNKAIKFDETTRTIYDVRYPDPSGDPQEVSIVFTEESSKEIPVVAKSVSDQLELMSGLRPALDAKINIHRDLSNLAEQTPLDGDTSISYYEAVDQVNKFFGDVYTNLGNAAIDEGRKRMVGPSRAFLKLLGFDNPRKKLSKVEIAKAKEMSMIEIIPEFQQTLFRGELYQTLEKNDAIVFDDTKLRNQYSVKLDQVENSRQLLLERIKVPTDFELPKWMRDTETGETKVTEKEIQAYFLLKKGFKKGQIFPKIEDNVLFDEFDLNLKSADIVIDQFIFNSINDELSRPDKKGLFPNVAGIVTRIGERVADRIKYNEATARNRDAFDRLQVADDLSGGNAETFYKELAELYGVEEATYDSIHSSLDAIKAENVWRGIRKSAERVLSSDPVIAKAMRTLAKETVFASDPTQADNMYPVKLFSEIALWASQNKQSMADSFRFRRKLLDHFPVATESSKDIHDAFEMSGAFAFNFKRVADKNTINMLIRNGMTKQEAEFVLDKRNLKRIVEETGITEQEAESIMRTQLRAQASYSAPSFVSSKHREYYRRINRSEIRRLGLESGNAQSVIQAIRKISRDGKTEQNKAVAQLLLRFPNILRDTEFVIIDADYDKAGDYSRLVNGTNRIWINTSGFYGVGVESVILHEYLHAITVDVLTKPEASLTSAQRGAKDRLKGLMKLSNNAYNERLQKTGVGSVEFEKSMENLEEFVASFFSSPSFQNQLKVLRQEKARSFFARIYDAILDIFGIKKDSPLDKAFDDLVDLVNVGNTKGRQSVESMVDKSLVETRNNGSKKRIVPVNKVEPESQIEARLSSFEPLDDVYDATPEQQAVIDTLVDQAVRSLVPSEVDVTIFDNQKEADANGIFADRPDAAIMAVLMNDSTGRSIPTIFINRANMRSALLSRNSLIDNSTMAKRVIETMFNEELFHIAEFNALSQEEVDSVASTIADTEFDDIVDQYTSIPERREQLKNALRGDDGAQIKNQLVGEMLRMHAQKVTRGFTSEEDIVFFESNPNIINIAFRYLRGFFRRMYARYNLNKNNPELAAAIHSMATELRFLQEGTYRPDTHLEFNPDNPDDTIQVLRQRFSAVVADITPETSDDDILKRFKGLFDSLELPVALYGRGEYQHMSKKWEQWIKGDVDPRISRLFNQQKFFEQATDALGKSMMSRISKLIDKTYGKGGIDPAILAAATGTTEFIKIDKDLKQKIQQDFRNAVASRKERVINGEIDPKWISSDSKLAMYKTMVTDRINEENAKLRSEVRAKQAAALDQISKDSPELAAALVEMRKITDAMSKTIKEKYNLSESLQIKFDNNMGIYLTRAYRAFNEEGYIEKVLESTDPKFVEIRQDAMEYFRNTYIKRLSSSKLRESIKTGKITGKAALTKEQATELATDEVNDNPAIVSQFMAQFLRAYSPDYRSRAGILPKGVTKSLINNLRRKSNLDPAVRKLLGEYDQETEGVNNLLRTYSVVTSMVARQSFYNNLIEMAKVRPVLDANNNPVLDKNGEPVQDGFLLTEDGLRERIKKNPMMQQEYVNIRTGKVYTPDSKEEIPAGLEGQYDPTYNYYGPKEMVDAMRRMYTPPVIDENLTGAQRAASGMVNIFNGLTGASLAIKTLGSLPFYLRNIVSNMFFFAPSQGFLGYGKMIKSMKLIGQSLKDPDKIDAYQAELITLGILNNEMASSMVKELLKGQLTVDSVNGEIDSILNKLKSAGAKGAELVKPVTERLQALSSAVDGFYKMAYFENELKTLRKAKQADINAGNKDSFYAKLTENEMKREAARKVLATAQSYSEAPPIVQESVRSIGMFVAPFLRFKTEVPRIVFNTYKEGYAEYKSGNPVISKRGFKRLLGMSSVLLGFSIAVPTAVRMFLGIGEDEDEALRDTVPHYLKDNTFFFFTQGDKLKSVDFTFLNPYSTLADPVLRASEHIYRGEPQDAVVAFTRSFFGEYLDEQIFTGALIDVARNKDSSTGKQIYYDADGLQIFSKSLFHIISGSFTPRTLEKAIEGSKTVRGEAGDPTNTLFWLVAGEFAPTKIHDVDVDAQLTKFLRDKRTERNDFAAFKNKLKTSKSLTDEDVVDLAKQFVESRIRIDEELYRGLRGFGGLPAVGLSDQELIAKLRDKDSGMGPRRTMLLSNKLTEKPVLDPTFIEDVLKLESGVGERRLELFQQEIDRLFPTRFMQLNP